MAMPDGAGVGLLLLVPEVVGRGEHFVDKLADDFADDLADSFDARLIAASRLGEAELRRLLATRGLGLADLRPSRVEVVRLGEAALAEARALNRARLAARYWHALES